MATLSAKVRGVVLIEVLLAFSIICMILPSILSLFMAALDSDRISVGELQAQAALQEQIEAVRSIRARDWEELATGSFCLELVGGVWELVTTVEGCSQGQLTGLVELEEVYRDEDNQLVESTDPGSRLDPSTYLVTARQSWGFLGGREINASVYLTRYLDNLSWEQTTDLDFEAGEWDLVKLVEPMLEDGELDLEGGCTTGNPESMIYDDQLQNGWRVNCDGLGFWEWLVCRILNFFNNASIQLDATTPTWDSSPNSIKLTLEAPGSGSFYSWARVFNYDEICTKGFKNIHFYAYNDTPQEAELSVTAVYDHWDNTTIMLPPGEWTEVSLDYETINEGYTSSLTSLYFSKYMSVGDDPMVVYLDQIELTGGVGGYFTDGYLTSSVFDAGHQTVFNRVSFEADEPSMTDVGLQVAVADSPTGPWLYYGPGGTTITSDEYLDPGGEGIWLGNNFGRYLRYQAHLSSQDGESSPILRSVSVNYAP